MRHEWINTHATDESLLPVCGEASGAMQRARCWCLLAAIAGCSIRRPKPPRRRRREVIVAHAGARKDHRLRRVHRPHRGGQFDHRAGDGARPAGQGAFQGRAKWSKRTSRCSRSTRGSFRPSTIRPWPMSSLAKAHLNRLEADLRRAKSLLPTKAISQEDYDKAEGDRERGGGHRQRGRGRHELRQGEPRLYDGPRQFAGRISRQMIDPGNMVKANDTLLTTLVSLDRMYIYFDVDERTTIRIRKPHRRRARSLRPSSHVTINYGLADEDGFPRDGQRQLRRQPDRHGHRHVAAAGSDRKARSALAARTCSCGSACPSASPRGAVRSGAGPGVRPGAEVFVCRSTRRTRRSTSRSSAGRSAMACAAILSGLEAGGPRCGQRPAADPRRRTVVDPKKSGREDRPEASGSRKQARRSGKDAGVAKAAVPRRSPRECRWQSPP